MARLKPCPDETAEAKARTPTIDNFFVTAKAVTYTHGTGKSKDSHPSRESREGWGTRKTYEARDTNAESGICVVGGASIKEPTGGQVSSVFGLDLFCWAYINPF